MAKKSTKPTVVVTVDQMKKGLITLTNKTLDGLVQGAKLAAKSGVITEAEAMQVIYDTIDAYAASH